jgi:hypothetical protein
VRIWPHGRCLDQRIPNWWASTNTSTTFLSSSARRLPRLQQSRPLQAFCTMRPIPIRFISTRYPLQTILDIHTPHTSKAGNLPLRFFQQLAIFDCCKVVLIWIGSDRYPVSGATWLSGCLGHMYILGYLVRIIGPDCGIEGIVREVMSAYCCHLYAELRWSFRMVQGTCVIEELEE